MNVTQTMTLNGNIVGEDGNIYNVVSLLGGGTAIEGIAGNPTQTMPVSGRIAGEDGKVYNLVDLLENVGKKQEIVDDAEVEATINTNTLYEYGIVDELVLTLSDDVGEYTVVFESGSEPTVLEINSSKELLWHNEPVVLANKVYCLAVSVGSKYARAVLSYAE